ncbi:MAG: GNAT family N-acetyltransferase [Salinispira sp.]
MNIRLTDVTQDIVDKVIALKVKEDQKDLTQDITHFLSQPNVEQDLRPLAIYHAEELVGFCVYGTDDEDGRVWIQTLIISAAHQGKGYSRMALEELINIIRRERNPAAIFACIREKNTAAQALFQKLKFSSTAEKEGDADVWTLSFE